MVGKKESTFNIMVLKLAKLQYFFLGCLIIVSSSCKQEPKDKASEFELLPRNSYYVDSYNDIGIYRFNDSNKVMDGYYVIGNKTSKWEEFSVKEGVLNGDYIIFHSNGEIFSHSQYLNGKLHGKEKMYSLSGKLKSLKTYKQGVPYGKKITYFESGEIQSESMYENEQIIESTSYNIIGEIVSQMFIKEGRKITQQIKSGKVYSEQISSTYDDFEAMKFYNEDGSLNVYLRMLEDDDNSFLIELNENGEEIKRIDVKANPQEAMKYFQYMQEL
ncbi:hypothetical protein [uncultured Algibacter sp.]|uniref:toxin-antitoxin system YwqK family antitoxin n=1 Tax=uncultured Algibacter sp. TaxID=298659 RepID=UPI00263714A2|nr:hypothetical protein [uncultured Algibacter sp.]